MQRAQEMRKPFLTEGSINKRAFQVDLKGIRKEMTIGHI